MQKMWKRSSVLCFVIICDLFHCFGRENTPTGHLLPLGSHRPPEGEISAVTHTLTPEVFYSVYVLPGKPVLLKGAAKLSAGFQLWTDGYLREKYGSVTVRVDYGKKENRARSADDLPLEEFLAIYNDSDRYLVDTLPEEMWDEFSLPNCLLCGGYTSRLQDAVLWFSSGGTKSFLHMDTVDNINCMISGVKDWFIVDLEHSKLIDMDHGEGDYCSVNVDKVDMFKYPSLQNLPWWSGRMDAGDCMFVPYGWAHQVTSHSRNIAVNIWWTPLSSFNSTDCQENLENVNESKAKLSNFKFTNGEQLRFLALKVLQHHGGSATFEVIHPLIVGEHTGQKLISRKSFSMLDIDQDGQLSIDELTSIPVDVVDEAFGRTPAGEVNIRGEFRRQDVRVTELLQTVGKQPPFVEEFLLREHKTAEDLDNFIVRHSEQLVDPVRVYLKELLSEARQEHETKDEHQEL